MVPGDLDVVGTALRRFMLEQGMAPSGELDTEEQSASSYSEEDTAQKRKHGLSKGKHAAAHDNLPKKRAKLSSSEESANASREDCGVGVDSEGRENGTAPEEEFRGERKGEEDISEEKRQARQSFRSQQRPAMESLVRLIDFHHYHPSDRISQSKLSVPSLSMSKTFFLTVYEIAALCSKITHLYETFRHYLLTAYPIGRLIQEFCDS